MRPAVFLLAAVLLLMASARPSPAVEGDIVFQRKGGVEANIPPAQFPHWAHRIRFKCYVCHDAIFKMKADADPITMEAISDGKFCGTCHDGKTAFAVGFDTCVRCHRE